MPSGRRTNESTLRTRSSARSKSRRGDHLLFAIATMVVGFLLVAAVRNAPQVLAVAGVGDRREDLIQVVHELEARRDELEMSLAVRRLEISALEAHHVTWREVVEEHSQQIRDLSMLTAMLAVHGPGLRITIADNPRPQGFPSDLEGALVHDYDLRALINALWSGGAEAIAINDERLTQLSAVRCVGPTVLVNNTRLASPFRIEAVGHTTSLAQALQDDDDSRSLINEHVERFGLLLKMEEMQNLRLPGGAGSTAPSALRRDEAP